jgi:hypothetical protein
VIEIESPPIDRCSCPPPLVWLWSPRRESWISFEPAGDMYAIRPHRCDGDESLPRTSWKSLLPRPDQAHINERGRRLVDVVIRQYAKRSGEAAQDPPEAS